ncbi:hypothetical protein DM02DRAFT_630047 [Periconia macrospinosa]|uniref:Uncharacterized protein n=1 Tax=Periconia macrospinosa TaxID=97972 RepID=A0A2V1DLH3_9PLEO|nr:hypothetical protein DM02DRAFT_630047 [Periconia macrospinosa]
MSTFSLFEIRLRDLVHVIYNADNLNMTPGWRKDLDSEAEEYWYKAVSDATMPKVKEILSKEDGTPPTIADIQGLDVIPQDKFTPGVYFGFSVPSDTSTYKNSICYTGSVTGVGWGLTKRVAQHLDPEYRRKELVKNSSQNTARGPTKNSSTLDPTWLRQFEQKLRVIQMTTPH